MPAHHLNPQQEYAAQLQNSNEWLTSNVDFIEQRINEFKEVDEPSLEAINEAVQFATQSLNAFQHQRFALLHLRDEQFDTQDMKDKTTQSIQACKRAEGVLKQWMGWLEYQQHKLTRLRGDEEE